jgi:glycosyltransferase involved in cell wall biosynthesis
VHPSAGFAAPDAVGVDAVTVVVPTRDRPAQLATCLASVRAALRDTDELIVVDSASVAAAEVADAAERVGARLIRCDRPGVDRARNTGWRSAAHDVVLFTDDDVVVDAGWRDALASAVVAHRDAGFVTGRVLPPDGQVPSRDVAIKRDETAEAYDEHSVGNLGHAASLAMRRAVLDRVGGFDEALGAGGRFKSAPETDLFDRCLAAGLSGWYEPSALAFHAQWRGPRRLLLLEARYGYGNGARLAKLVRTDRARAKLVRRDAVLGWGLHEVGRELRAGHGYPALGGIIRMLATIVGFGRARLVPVVNGHFHIPDAR